MTHLHCLISTVLRPSILTVALCLGLLSTAMQATAAESRPNIVLIMADDLGARELACYGHQQHQTPHLDRLASEGMRFRTCYATPICTSTRVLIMTGQYGFRTGYFNFLKRTYSPRPDSPQYDIGSNLTFADVLKTRGYATAAVGKWQLTGQIPELIHDCGFDEYRTWTWLHKLPEGVKHTGAWQSRRRRVPSRFWHPGILENDKYLPTEPSDYGPDLFCDFVIDFIERNQKKPFLLYFPMALTHTPWDPTPDLKRPGKKTKPGLRSNVEYMDHIVGRIVDTLDKLKLRENTLLIFTGDNGTEGDGKATVTEKGARVPLIANMPGTVPAGRVSDALVDLSDMMPTLAELAGATIDPKHKIDGVSLLPTLRGESTKHRDWIFSYLSDRRLLRDHRWLLEGNGRFYDCGTSRNGQGCRDVTDSTDAEVVAARQRFDKILKGLPGPQGLSGLVQPKKKGT